MSDREKAGLRGPVKTCADEGIFVAVGNVSERKASSMREYDRDGRSLSSRTTNPGGPDWVSHNSYDPQGRLLRTTSGPVGMESVVAVYSYDENGRLLRVVNPQDGSRSEIHYDAQGRKIKLQIPGPNSHSEGFAVAGSPFLAAEAGLGIPLGSSVRILYNQQDVAIEVHNLDAEGHVVSRIIRTFDPEGRVLGEKQIFENAQFLFPPQDRAKIMAEAGVSAEELATELDKQLRAALGGEASFYSTSNKYDTQGRVAEVRTRVGPGREQVVATTYNDQGDIATEEHTSTWPAEAAARDSGAAAAFSLPRPRERFELRYEYSYDSLGNWTERTTKSRSNPDEPFKVVSTTRRQLTYY
jgi:YD repeat-containing protein